MLQFKIDWLECLGASLTCCGICGDFCNAIPKEALCHSAAPNFFNFAKCDIIRTIVDLCKSLHHTIIVILYLWLLLLFVLFKCTYFAFEKSGTFLSRFLLSPWVKIAFLSTPNLLKWRPLMSSKLHPGNMTSGKIDGKHPGSKDLRSLTP